MKPTLLEASDGKGHRLMDGANRLIDELGEGFVVVFHVMPRVSPTGALGIGVDVAQAGDGPSAADKPLFPTELRAMLTHSLDALCDQLAVSMFPAAVGATGKHFEAPVYFNDEHGPAVAFWPALDGPDLIAGWFAHPAGEAVPSTIRLHESDVRDLHRRLGTWLALREAHKPPTPPTQPPPPEATP